jgi:hypothetical protein
MVDIVNTPEMRVQKDYAFNLALLEIKQEAARWRTYIIMKKYTLRCDVYSARHISFPPISERDARIFIILL